MTDQTTQELIKQYLEAGGKITRLPPGNAEACVKPYHSYPENSVAPCNGTTSTKPQLGVIQKKAALMKEKKDEIIAGYETEKPSPGKELDEFSKRWDVSEPTMKKYLKLWGVIPTTK